MATTAREGTIPTGKERRGVSPSPHVKKTPTASKSSSAQKNSSVTSPPSDKPIPNYLKPTISSSHDTSRIHNKSTSNSRSSTDTSAQKPILNRRRSFDKPPSPARLQKSIQGTTGKTTAASTNNKTLRSASFTSKTALRSSSVLEAERSKNASPSSSSLLRSRSSVKKTATNISGGAGTKKDLRTSLSKKKAPKSVTSESSVDGLESHDHHNKDLGAGAEHFLVSEDDDEGITDIIDHVHEVQSLPDISEMPGHKDHLADPLTTETLVEEDDMEEKEEISAQLGHDNDDEKLTPLSHDDDDDDIDDTNNIADQKTEQEATAETEEEQDKTAAKAGGANGVDIDGVNQNEDIQGDEGIHEEDPHSKTQDREDGKQADHITNDGEAKDDQEESVEDKKEEEQQVLGSEAPNKEETTEVDGAIQQAKAAVETQNTTDTSAVKATPASASKAAGGKKDQQVYNDVIEETSKKLMDQNRRNKVKALAGAFETVISLQDTKN